jgi:hypothetical protein
LLVVVVVTSITAEDFPGWGSARPMPTRRFF